MDLERAGVIPNAFLADNEEKVAWVALHSWTYSRSFRVPKAVLDAGHVELVFDGLDTVATVMVNGEEAGHADNMFIPWRFDVKKLLKAGDNEVSVEFASPVEEASSSTRSTAASASTRGPATPRAYLRKAQYSYGWDWGPKLTTSGIWRSVSLASWDTARIDSVCWRTTRATPDSARVKVTVEALGSSRVSATARLSLGKQVRGTSTSTGKRPRTVPSSPAASRSRTPRSGGRPVRARRPSTRRR